MLFVLGFSAETGKSRFITLMALFNLVLALVTYFMNKSAVRKEFVPRQKRVDELIQVMEQA
jgi:hypothetical protein